MKDGIVRRIILHPAVELYAPPHVLEEIEEHEEEILRKVPGRLYRLMMSELKRKLIIVGVGELVKFREEARRIAKEFDIDDWPFIALALKLKIPIWTNDKELIKQGVESCRYLPVDTIVLSKSLKGEVDLSNWPLVKEDIKSRFGKEPLSAG